MDHAVMLLNLYGQIGPYLHGIAYGNRLGPLHTIRAAYAIDLFSAGGTNSLKKLYIGIAGNISLVLLKCQNNERNQSKE